LHTLVYEEILENSIMRFSASAKDCSNSYTDTVRAETTRTLYNESVISLKIILHTVCKIQYQSKLMY